MRGLRAAGVPITWSPLGWPSERWRAPFGPLTGATAAGSDQADVVDLDIVHDTVVLHSTPYWHDQLGREAEGRLLVAFTAWETDRLDPETVATLDRFDRVLVPSRFNVEVLESSGVRVPVRAVPHIASPLDPTASVDSANDGDTTFRFYVIATWTSRKAILDTVEAYLKAFSATDDVSLLIHTTPEDLVAVGRLERGGQFGRGPTGSSWYALANALAGRGDVPEISLSTRPIDQAGIAALHARGDCFVSLSRGEAWGLGAFDAGAAGNPVIVTGWGGTPEFLPDDYPYLVDYTLAPTTEADADAWWVPRPGERWATASIGHAASLMRHVYEHRDEAADRGRALEATITTTYDAATVTRRLLQCLESGSDRLV
jgi:glycosyltransferase involved in cell wall biosynthesis